MHLKRCLLRVTNRVWKLSRDMYLIEFDIKKNDLVAIIFRL